MPDSNIIVFDIDGTLTDSVQVHQSSLETALESFNFPALRTDWGSYRHHSDSAIFSEAWEEAGFKGKADIKCLELAFATAYDHERRQISLQEVAGVHDFMSWLNATTWTRVFATGSLRHGAMDKLSAIGIDGNAEVLVTASELETREDIVFRAVEEGCRRNGADIPSRVISIGDGTWDMKTAHNLGYEFIGIDFMRNKKIFSDLGVPVFRNFRDIMKNGLKLFDLC